jgi:hypothetical protein
MQEEQMSVVVGILFAMASIIVGVSVAMGTTWWVLTNFI